MKFQLIDLGLNFCPIARSESGQTYCFTPEEILHIELGQWFEWDIKTRCVTPLGKHYIEIEL